MALDMGHDEKGDAGVAAPAAASTRSTAGVSFYTERVIKGKKETVPHYANPTQALQHVLDGVSSSIRTNYEGNQQSIWRATWEAKLTIIGIATVLGVLAAVFYWRTGGKAAYEISDIFKLLIHTPLAGWIVLTLAYLLKTGGTVVNALLTAQTTNDIGNGLTSYVRSWLGLDMSETARATNYLRYGHKSPWERVKASGLILSIIVVTLFTLIVVFYSMLPTEHKIVFNSILLALGVTLANFGPNFIGVQGGVNTLRDLFFQEKHRKLLLQYINEQVMVNFRKLDKDDQISKLEEIKAILGDEDGHSLTEADYRKLFAILVNFGEPSKATKRQMIATPAGAMSKKEGKMRLAAGTLDRAGVDVEAGESPEIAKIWIFPRHSVLKALIAAISCSAIAVFGCNGYLYATYEDGNALPFGFKHAGILPLIGSFPVFTGLALQAAWQVGFSFFSKDVPFANDFAGKARTVYKVILGVFGIFSGGTNFYLNFDEIIAIFGQSTLDLWGALINGATGWFSAAIVNLYFAIKLFDIIVTYYGLRCSDSVKRQAAAAAQAMQDILLPALKDADPDIFKAILKDMMTPRDYSRATEDLGKRGTAPKARLDAEGDLGEEAGREAVEPAEAARDAALVREPRRGALETLPDRPLDRIPDNSHIVFHKIYREMTSSQQEYEAVCRDIGVTPLDDVAESEHDAQFHIISPEAEPAAPVAPRRGLIKSTCMFFKSCCPGDATDDERKSLLAGSGSSHDAGRKGGIPKPPAGSLVYAGD